MMSKKHSGETAAMLAVWLRSVLAQAKTEKQFGADSTSRENDSMLRREP